MRTAFVAIFLVPVLLALTLTTAAEARKGGSGGTADTGGADAVQSAKGIEILDLAEKEGFVIDGESAYQNQALPRLAYLEKFYYDYSRQFHEDEEDDSYLSNDLAKAKSSLLWFWVDQPLPEINDEGTDNYFVLVKGQKVQLAVQRDNHVYVRRDLYQQMDERNQGALYLHEMMLRVAFQQSRQGASVFPGAEKIDLTKNGTAKIRSFVSALMSPAYEQFDFQQLRNQLSEIGIQDVVSRGCIVDAFFKKIHTDCYQYEEDIVKPINKSSQRMLNVLEAPLGDMTQARNIFVECLQRIGAKGDLDLSNQDEVKILKKFAANPAEYRSYIPEKTLGRFVDRILIERMRLVGEYYKSHSTMQRMFSKEPDFTDASRLYATLFAFDDLLREWRKEEEQIKKFSPQFYKVPKTPYQILME